MLTRNPVLGAVAGALVTAVLQSSSATTVMVIGFVSAGLMKLPQAISVVLGANIGTTITAQVEAATEGTVSFPLFDYDGYRATLNGQEIAVETGDNNRVQIRVPAGTDGEVRIWFAGKRWWKITDAVSLAALLAVLLRRKFGKQA